VGSGWFGTVGAASHALVELREAAYPSPDTHRYENAYQRYGELYPALAPTFHTMHPSAEPT
jgi:hypothetical protein